MVSEVDQRLIRVIFKIWCPSKFLIDFSPNWKLEAGSRRPPKVRPKGGTPKERPKGGRPELRPKGALLVAKPATYIMPPLEAGVRQKELESSLCRPPSFCHRWKPEATKSTSKKRPEPARIKSKGSPTCRKAGHL
jgi:hypothetical protein